MPTTRRAAPVTPRGDGHGIACHARYPHESWSRAFESAQGHPVVVAVKRLDTSMGTARTHRCGSTGWRDTGVSNELLEDPEVKRVIRLELLRGGYQEHLVDDGVRDVIKEVWEYLDERGEDIKDRGRMKAIVRPWAYKRGQDALRGKYTSAEAMAKAADIAAAQAAQAAENADLDKRIDQRGAIENVVTNPKSRDAELIPALVDGESPKEIAARLKVTPNYVSKAIASMQERHGTRLGKLGYAGVIGAIVAALWIVFKITTRDPREANPTPPLPAPSESAQPLPKPNPTGVANPAPDLPPAPSSSAPPAITPEQKAKLRDLRARGHAAAQKKSWQACWDAYHEAELIDPAGTPPAALDEADRCKAALDAAEGQTPR